MSEVTNLAPSTRDLMQFISPNPSDTEDVYLFVESSGSDLEKHKDKFHNWEDANIAALIIDTQTCSSDLPLNYLKDAITSLECPILRKQTILNDDELTQTRELGFDGLITDTQQFSSEDFQHFYARAQSMHCRLIPIIKSTLDWDKVKTVNPKFIFLNSLVEEGVISELKQAKTFNIGKKDLQEKIFLKCLINQIN